MKTYRITMKDKSFKIVKAYDQQHAILLVDRWIGLILKIEEIKAKI
jgi:hypothetical protein